MWKSRQPKPEQQKERPAFIPAQLLNARQALNYMFGGRRERRPAGDWLIDHIMSIGPGVSWENLESWLRLRKLEFDWWEIETMYQVSQDYKRFAEDEQLCSPYMEQVDPDVVDNMFMQFKASMGAEVKDDGV